MAEEKSPVCCVCKKEVDEDDGAPCIGCGEIVHNDNDEEDSCTVACESCEKGIWCRHCENGLVFDEDFQRTYCTECAKEQE